MTQAAQQPTVLLPVQALSEAASKTARARGVAVLGMHRSGTSAVAGLLAAAGFHAGAGDELFGADEHNPAGYFERAGVVETNNAVLESLGSGWDVPPVPAQVLAVRDDHVAEASRQLRELLGAAGTRPVVLKDPRMSVLMPLWWPLLRDTCLPVLVLRNPLETARSLARRDSISLSAGLALWEIYMSAVLDALEGETVHLVSYEQLLVEADAGARLVEDLRGRLRPDAASALSGSGHGSVDPSLHRNQASDEDFAEHSTAHQRLLWSYLSGLGPGAHRLTTPERLRRATGASLTTVRHDASLRGQALENGQRLVEQELELAATREERDLRGRRVAELTATVEHLSDRVEAVVAERDLRGQRVAQLEAELAEVRVTAAQLQAVRELLSAAERDRERLRESASDTLQRLRTEAADHAATRRAAAEDAESRARLEGELAVLVCQLDVAHRARDQHAAELAAVLESETWKAGRMLVAPLHRMAHPFRRRR